MSQLLEIVLSTLGALGGGALIIGLFTKWLSDFWSKKLVLQAKAMLDKELENHKIGLKKSELIFQKEYEAASAMVVLCREIDPKHPYEGMDSEDAGSEIAHNFSNIEKLTERFIRDHGASLSDSVKESVLEILNTSSSCKNYERDPGDLYQTGLDLWKLAQKAEDESISQFRQQIIK